MLRVLAVAVPVAWSGQALAQSASPVFMDDSPRAADSMFRAGELASIGNLDEAVRVLQSVLDEEAERVLPSSADQNLFVPVRQRINEMLLGSRPLLDRYRELESARAGAMLEAGDLAGLERTRLLTTPGFEAALRLAQERLEGARFHSARFVLEQLERHPDRKGDAGRDAARLLSMVSSYADDEAEAIEERSARWAREAGIDPVPGLASRPPIDPAYSLYEACRPVELAEMLPRPLWSDALGDELPLSASNSNRGSAFEIPENAQLLYCFPSAVGDTLYTNDTHTVTAWNRFTLSPRWRARFEGVRGRGFIVGPQQGFEEVSAVASDGIHAATLIGFAIQGQEQNLPARRVVLLDAATGRVRWTRSMQDLDLSKPDLPSRPRGPVALHEGLVIVGVTRDDANRRLESTALAGIDVETGSLVWFRLLASTGSASFAFRATIYDPMLCERGLVYATDRMGHVSCVEAATGRTRWIRRITGAILGGSADQAWEASQPVRIGDSLFVIQPDSQALLRIDALTGELLASAHASAFESPNYLVAVDGQLVTVSRTMLMKPDLATFGPGVKSAVLAKFQQGQIRGRVVAAGNRVLVPVVTGIEVYDLEPNNPPAPVMSMDLEKPGNVLPLDSQLIVADDREVHTYLFWETAEAVLRQQMAANPDDPSPAITYMELAYRALRPGAILGAVDKALATIERDPLGATTPRHQERLFRSLFEMIEPDTTVEASLKLDLELRGALIERLGRCASGPEERVAYLLASGAFYEATAQPGRSVEAFQQILDQPELAQSSFKQGQSVISADFEATRRLRRTIQLSGRAVYAAYEADAARLLEQAAESVDPADFEAIGRRYPVSRAAVSAWMEAAKRYTRQGKPMLAGLSFEEGLTVARDALDPGDPLVGELTGRLVHHLMGVGLHQPALATLQSFLGNAARPPLTLEGTPVDEAGLVESLQARIDQSVRRPHIGPRATETRQMLGWSLVLPLADDAPTSVLDRVMMISDEDEMAMWRAVGPGPLVQAWGGVRDEHFLWTDPDGVMFGRSVEDGDRIDYSFARRDLDTGRVLWESQAFRDLVPRNEIDDLLAATPPIAPRIDTPLRTSVQVTSLLLAFDNQTMVVLDRMGRAAALDLPTGRLLWRSASIVPRVHDAKLRSGLLVVGGAVGPIDLADPARDIRAAEPLPGLVVALDARSGQEVGRFDSDSRIRWVEVTPEGAPVVGLDEGIIALDVYRNRLRWRSAAKELRGSLAGWMLVGRAIVRDERNRLWHIDSSDGAVAPVPLDVRGRLDDGFGYIRLAPLDAGASLITRQGLAVFDNKSELRGIDIGDGDSPILFGGFGAENAVTLSLSPIQGDGLAVQYVVSVYSNDSLKSLSHTTVSLGVGVDVGPVALIEGKLLITTGSVVSVVELPE